MKIIKFIIRLCKRIFIKKVKDNCLEINEDDLILELQSLPKNKIVQEIIWDMKQIYGNNKVLKQSKKNLKKIGRKDLLKIMMMIKQENSTPLNKNIMH